MTYTIDTSHPSPNHSSRQGADISMIVLHATVGSYASSLAWLTNPASRVSTHYLISKTGHIAQLVADSEAAWHAGVSQWFDLNSAAIQHQSIGIELENDNNGRDPYPSAQMDALLWLSYRRIEQYKIAPGMVTRHLDIALPHGRKTDPAGFPWLPFKALLFAPPPKPYRVVGLPVYQAANHQGTVAGHVLSGDDVVIDDPNNGHIIKINGIDAALGFVDMNGLEAA
jgi:N-acetyl-anhydromuramyl-L-alanine amidase AmpD